MTEHTQPRRVFLRSSLACLALPWTLSTLESQESSQTSSKTKTAFFYLPNGAVASAWCKDPKQKKIKQGRHTAPLELGESTAALQPFAQHINRFQGLSLRPAKSLGDGAGDHARSAAAFLTAQHPLKVERPPLRSGISIDQVIAKAMGQHYRLPSLHCALRQAATTGTCDSGYHCSYSEHIAWYDEQRPVPNLVKPADIFVQLFGNLGKHSKAELQQLWQRKKSILDEMKSALKKERYARNSLEQQAMDEYLSTLRVMEKKVGMAMTAKHINPDMPYPHLPPSDSLEHRRQIVELIALAFRHDLTPVATMMFGREGSGKVYSEIGLQEGHHSLSHHGRDPQKIKDLKAIDRLIFADMAYFCECLEKGKGSSWKGLEQCQILFGSGINDGQDHSHDDLPILSFGGASGRMKTGQVVTHPKHTPIANLYLSLLDNLDMRLEQFGDSNGRCDLS